MARFQYFLFLALVYADGNYIIRFIFGYVPAHVVRNGREYSYRGIKISPALEVPSLNVTKIIDNGWVIAAPSCGESSVCG